MSSNYTPGPWAVQKAEHCTGRQLDDLVKWVVTGDENDLWISTGPTWDPEHAEESEANARLIAAAPELLDLLGRVAYHMEGGIRMEYPASPEESPQPASEWDHEADRLAGEARRLLAKATGAT